MLWREQLIAKNNEKRPHELLVAALAAILSQSELLAPYCTAATANDTQAPEEIRLWSNELSPQLPRSSVARRSFGITKTLATGPASEQPVTRRSRELFSKLL